MKYINLVNYEELGYKLTIGRAAPWDRRIQIPIPALIYRLFVK